jgi:serine/threonine protein kinase
MTPSLVGKTLFSRYRIEEFITRTPLGDLHRAVDERHARTLALTLLPPVMADKTEIIKRLEEKPALLQGVSHPNLARYLGVHHAATHIFLLEEWVDGPSLRDVLARSTVSVDEALVYASAVCRAFEALHAKKFLHGNLIPEFIRIDEEGEIVVSGIGNAIPIGETPPPALGKYPPLYLAPEHIQTQPLTAAADMYSLAVILYEMLTGAWLNGKHAPKTNDAILRNHLEATPPAPRSLNRRIPDHFSRMILWALRKNPDERLKTPTELLSSLALAAQIPLDKIPLRAKPTTAPVTSTVLSEWEFLPPPPPGILQDTLPLDERLTTVATPKKKAPRIGILPIIIFLLLAGFLSLFWFVRPAELPIIALEQSTPFTVDFTPPPTFTPMPRPTDPHGGRIAFTCTRGDFHQLCMINRDGTGLIQVTDMQASNYYPRFTPDGNALLFASNRNGAFDLYLLVFNDRNLLQITNRIGNVISPDFSPDGRYIVFPNRVGNNPTAIWMVNVDGLNPRLVYTGTGDIVATAWSPDGEKIAYAMSVGIPQEYEIFVMDANGRNHQRISQGLQGIGGSLDWSPDGSHLLIHAGPFGNKDIFRLDVNTGDYVQITNGGNNAGASYSPDGRFIVFNSLRNNDQADLYIMRADGTNEMQLTNHPEPDWGARWVD